MAPKKAAGKEPAAKGSVPPNASLLVTRLKVDQMEKLILKSIVDGTALTMDDITHALDGGKVKTKAEAETVDTDDNAHAKKIAAPVLERMCTVTRAELDHDFAQFDKNGDGTLTLTEFIEIMNHNVKPEDRYEDSELVGLFQEMDKDGGGTICYHEFAVQWAADRANEDGD